MASKTRETRIVAAVACPTCGVGVGQWCRKATAHHDYRRGTVDLREALPRVHTDRRLVWIEYKRQHEV